MELLIYWACYITLGFGLTAACIPVPEVTYFTLFALFTDLRVEWLFIGPIVNTAAGVLIPNIACNARSREIASARACLFVPYKISTTLPVEALFISPVSFILGNHTFLYTVAPETVSRMGVIARLTATKTHLMTLAILSFIARVTLQIVTF